MDKKDSLMHSFNSGSRKRSSVNFILIMVATIALGIGSGYLLSRMAPGAGFKNANPSPVSKNGIEKGKVYGSNDTSTFKDSTEGVLKDGGIEGEGQYHLERPGGTSQNVYLTSSLVDLSLFLNHKIKIWGQTMSAQKAGWLMDVGRVEVIE